MDSLSFIDRIPIRVGMRCSLNYFFPSIDYLDKKHFEMDHLERGQEHRVTLPVLALTVRVLNKK